MTFDDVIDFRGQHSNKWDMMEANFGVSPKDDFQTIRKHYHRLVREHHPDRLIARGLPASFQAIANDRMARKPGSVSASLARLIGEAGIEQPDVVLSGATGLADLAAEELAGIRAALPGAGIRATGDIVGHPMEVAAPFGAALGAALCAAGSAREVAITSVGHRRGEGVIRVLAA